MKKKDLALYFDHTALSQCTTRKDIERLCSEAINYQFATVCVAPCWISLCRQLLSDSGPLVCTVIGFPLGSQTIKSKLFECENAIGEGAQEIDLVMNIGALKSGDDHHIREELKSLVAKNTVGLSKVIVESGALTDEEIVRATQLVNESGADFIKTSTGFHKHGASLNAVNIMARHKSTHLKIKASGGIKTLSQTYDYIEAGASRIGASSSVTILKELEE